MSDSSDSETIQSDNSETIQSDNSESIQSDESESTSDGNVAEVIQSTDPNIQIDNQELIDFRARVGKHINNLNKLKQLNDGQKNIQLQKKALLNENRELQKEIVAFAEDYDINKITMKNGYVLTFTTIERPKPINEDILRSGIAEQLKHYKNNDTIGAIGVDKFISELIGSIDSKRKEGVQGVKSVKFTKPKSNGGQKKVKNKKPKKNRKI